jgi:DNA-binding MarR family transcriptional regulator
VAFNSLHYLLINPEHRGVKQPERQTMSITVDMARHRAPVQDESFRSEYLQSLRLIERLHRLLLDVIKDEFDREGGSDLNSVQALLLYNIGDSELTAGELKTRGYYLGSNVSYNLKKLVDMGYITYKRSETDRRSVRVSLSERGKEASAVVANLYQRQLGSVQAVGEITGDDFRNLNKALVRLERFWSDQIRYQL